MSKQIEYYKFEKLEAKNFKHKLTEAVLRLNQSLESNEGRLDLFFYFTFSDETVSAFLVHLARLPVFSKDFQELFKDQLEVLVVLKKLKYFTNLHVKEILYLLAKLVRLNENEDSIEIGKYFMAKTMMPQLQIMMDLKFKDVITRNMLFVENPEMTQKYLSLFQELEEVEPHAIYPTSIYRQSDGCTVATNDCCIIEATMSTTLTTSIRISPHVLGFQSNLLAEVYCPIGRVVVVMDDKLSDPTYTVGPVCLDTNQRVVATTDDGKNLSEMSISDQLVRYFDYHGVKVEIISKSGNEADKQLTSVQNILIDLKKIGVMRNEPVLVVGGGVIADVAGFACALFHRNTPYVMLATSIVSGIDAGPSPRTCCDGSGYKNAFGAYHPPVLTLTDRTLWKTMHNGMVRHGIAEIVKMACVENRELFELLENVGPSLLVKTKFGTDYSAVDLSTFDRVEFESKCEQIVGLAMESYVRAEYGNLWETHQCRPHAFGHTWSPGYELPAGMLHGHAVATCMGFGAYLSYKHCGWITEESFLRICRLINGLELALWHDVMEDKQIFHASTKKMIQKRGGNLAAPIPRHDIGQVGYLNDITDHELSNYLMEYKALVTNKLALDRDGYGVEVHMKDVGLEDTHDEATAFVRAEGFFEESNRVEDDSLNEEKKDEMEEQAPGSSYNEWIASVQAQRNSEWKFNVSFEKAEDTDSAPHFPQNMLFHNVVEDYAMKHTSVASKNIQTAANVTMEKNMFAPCMVGTLESQFLKIQAKQMKAKKILDVGTFTGMSAIAFAEGQRAAKVPEIHVDTLECDQTCADTAQKIFDSCEPEIRHGIHLHRCNAAEYMRSLAADPNGPTYDIIFLDADKENYSTYYRIAMGDGVQRPLLADDGVILADNSLCALLYDENDERRDALHHFNQLVKNDDRVEQVVMTIREGVTLITRV